MQRIELDKSKLLGYGPTGEPLFDLVIENGSDGSNAIADSRAVGGGKPTGTAKAIGMSKVEGSVKV